MRVFALMPAAAIAIMASHADAQNVLVLGKLQEWNTAAPAPAPDLLVQQLRKKADELYGRTAANCTQRGVEITQVEPATGDRFTFAALLRGSIRNAWFVTARLPACDAAPVRFMVIQQSEQGFTTIRVNRGISYAWESLISDTLPLAVTSASVALSRKGLTCPVDDRAVLGITRIAGQDANLGPATFGVRYVGQWSEVWPFQTCGKTVEVLVRFTADGDGGAYTNVPGDEVKVLP